MQPSTSSDQKTFWERSFDAPRVAKYGCFSTIGVLLVGFILLVGYCSDQSTLAAAERQKQEAADKAKSDKESAENHRKGFHCLSAWDGSEPDVVRLVKDRLRDPDSFEHIETRITPVNDKGFHELMMRYRSRNGFGGMTEGIATAKIISSGCTVIMTGVAG